MKEKFGIGECVFTSSGRSALKLCLSLLSRKSNRIGLPTYTCPVLYEAIIDSGFNPVPIDVEYGTLELNIEGLRKECNVGLDALILVHLFGDPVSVKEIRSTISEIPVIEDCAQGIGAVKDSKPVGSSGDFSIFSFGFGKTVTGGIGGALAINSIPFSKKLDEARERLRRAGHTQRFRALFWMTGMKFGSLGPIYEVAYPFFRTKNRREELESADRIISKRPSIGEPMALSPCVCDSVNSQLDKLEAIICERRKNARLILSSLEGLKIDFELSHQSENFSSTFTRLIVRLDPTSRTHFERAFLKNGIEVESPYKNTLEKLLGSSSKCPGAMRLMSRSLSLPVHNRMNEDKIHKLGEVARDAAGDSTNV